MTLEQVEGSLPNGLHDAQIQQLVVDYEHSRLTLRVFVLVGLPGQPRPDRDSYRLGEILFQKLLFFSIDPPQVGSAFQQPGSVWFSYERTAPEGTPAAVRQTLSPATQCYSLFVHDWLSHIQIAADEVSFSWVGA